MMECLLALRGGATKRSLNFELLLRSQNIFSSGVVARRSCIKRYTSLLAPSQKIKSFWPIIVEFVQRVLGI